MRIGKAWRWGLAALLLLPGCMTAPPAVPAPTAAALPGAAAPAAPASAPANLWSFLCPTPQQKQECRQWLCNSFLGKMLGSLFTPLSMLTGGSTTSACSQLANLQGLAMPADSAGGATARIKQEEAGAEQRRLDVRYLGTVDCRYWPEAEGALIKALRSDPNECVRYEAATALTHGCCCGRPVMEALVTTVSGSDKDGLPAERSERVKAAALEALHHCLNKYTAVVPAPTPTPPERPTPPEKPGPEKAAALPPTARASSVVQTGYYQDMPHGMDAQVLEEARRLDLQYPPWPQPGQNGLFGLFCEIQKVPIHPPTASANPGSPSSVEPPLFPVPDIAADSPIGANLPQPPVGPPPTDGVAPPTGGDPIAVPAGPPDR